jgi:putative copper export protein/mono/diheme cytochrome c family protein/peroxiredoxin
VHVAACVGLVGIASFLLLAGRSELAAAGGWQRQMVRWSRALVVSAIAGGVVALGHQTAVFEGRPGAALDAAAIGRVLLDTQVGVVWLARHALLLLLAGLLFARVDLSRAADWFALRVQALLLAVLALGLLGASGHALAVEPGTAQAIGVAVVHLVATGLWIGGLPALAALLRVAGRDGSVDACAYAAGASRRFSHAALAAVLVLAGTGIMNALSHVESIPALVGTPYGRMLLLKLALLAVILVLAARARRHFVPALLRGAHTALGSLRRVALAETGLAAAILLIVAVMSLTQPARHDAPVWPFPFRLASSAQASNAALLPAAVLPANPATYVRPEVPYSASSIVSGAALYERDCAACHGERGAGLRMDRVAQQTAGDLFWLLTHGGTPAKMPGFGKRLSAESRWDLVNFMRTLEAAQTAQRAGAILNPKFAPVVAPDFIFSVGPIPPQALRDFRGRRAVFLVLYTLPASLGRIHEIAHALDALDLAGVEIIAVPTDAAPDAIRRLGAERGLYFSVVTDGASHIVPTYQLLAGGVSHAEFLIDRQGYIRGRWAGAAELRPVPFLLTEVIRLQKEQPVAPPAEHIH